MKNLKLYSEITLDLELEEEEVLLCSAIDLERNRLFFASSSNFIYIIFLASSSKEKKWSKNLLNVQGGLGSRHNITAVEYLIEEEALIIGTLDGDLILNIVDENISEVVGRVDSGVKAIAPSPDGALLAVTTGSGKILVMTRDWDVLHEMMLDPSETQNSVIAGDVDDSSCCSFESSISWRGDGKYFTTLSSLHNPSFRKINIWERESGALHASSESHIFMGTALDWMPSGAKIVAAFDRKSENRSPLIVFFERNGLERSNFSIEESEAVIEILKWNCNSDLLAFIARLDGYDTLKIWYASNNHWYMKQEIRFKKEFKVKFTWDPIKPLCLICWTTQGQIIRYNFLWKTAVMDNSVALVIDGARMHVSPLSQSLIPLPMSLFDLKFSSSIRDLAFLAGNTLNHLAIQLSDGSLCVAKLSAIETWEDLEGKEFYIEKCHSSAEFGNIRHMVWLNSHVLLGVSSCQESQQEFSLQESFNTNGFIQKHAKEYCSILWEIEVECSAMPTSSLVFSSGQFAKFSKNLVLYETVIGIVPNPTQMSAFIQYDGGIVCEYSSNLGILKAHNELYQQNFTSSRSFSSSCPWMRAVSFYDKGTVNNLLFGLDESGGLHIGGNTLCYNCSSFSLYSNTGDVEIITTAMTHLIFTTKQDALYVVKIEDILHGNGVKTVENKRWDDSADSINIWERGSKVIGVIHGDESAVILQTVRGNLECIYPRKLVLMSVVNALTEKRFKDAMMMVRRHRLDFNIIVDHFGWNVFLKEAREFVRQVGTLSHLTEFICSVKEENIIETLYKDVISLPIIKDTPILKVCNRGIYGTKSKVSSVLMAIKNALEEHIPESPARELCILTTFARSEPPLLEEALKRIKVIREMELLGSDDIRQKSNPSAEEAAKHLLWLSDSECVYEAALGLYDLNLAAIVALNSDKDPKEFLPFLQGLGKMPSEIMQYTIDLKLHRYESALRHIFSAGDTYWDDFINLIKQNPQLFPLGLQMLTDHGKRNQILEAWGDHLYRGKHFEDAAVIYLRCSSLEKSLKAYHEGGHWKGVLTVAGLLKLGKKEVLQLANDLCEELHALGKPAEAATIAMEYCDDVSSAINYLITAREWEEALRIGFMREREDLISVVRSAAQECASLLMSEYEEGIEKIGKYLARYLAVRQRRLVLLAKIQSEDAVTRDDDDDTASEASSTFSGLSAYTMGTLKSSKSTSPSVASKSRGIRRQRNRGKIRAGSPDEEMALAEHLKGMAPTVSAQRELKSLVLALISLGEEGTSRKTQRAGENFQIAQMAASKLVEDTMSSEIIDDVTYSLDHYVQKLKAESRHPQSSIFLS